MTHAERLYLLGRLALVDQAAARAAAEREVFHPLPIYTPLASGLQVRAERAQARVVLHVRHPSGMDRRAAVDDAFGAFFLDGCDRSPPETDGGWTLHAGSAPATAVADLFTKEHHARPDPNRRDPVAPGPGDPLHATPAGPASARASASRPRP